MKKNKTIIILSLLLIILSAVLFIPRNSIKPVGSKIEALPTKKDLFIDYYDKAKEIMSSMTLEEKVGQMFFVRYSKDASKETINEKPGGYILFARDFKNETKESILEKLNENQKNSKIKLFFGVDEEGGTVVRVSKYPEFRETPFLSPQELFNNGGFDSVLADLDEKIELLKSIGINTNFAPVVDIPISETSYIYKRSFGLDLNNTIRYASLVVEKMNENKMISIMKHFPGYGDNIDTHTGIAIDNRTYEELKVVDLKPFKAGIETKAPIIMINHNIITNIDNNPASLSRKVHDILRNDLRFTGLIITDDLTMGSIKDYENVAVQAILAGNDIILSSDFIKQKKQVLDAIRNGIIDESIINEAVIKILACKLAYEIV